jgi:hypothetical protein
LADPQLEWPNITLLRRDPDQGRNGKMQPILQHGSEAKHNAAGGGSQMTRAAVGPREVPVHWVDICRVMRIMGLMDDFSKGECLRIATLLEKQVKAGTAKKLSRGVYAAVLEDREAAIDAP